MAKWIYKWYHLIFTKLVVIVIIQCQLSGFWIMSGTEANLWVWPRALSERINCWQWQHPMDWTKGQRPSSGLSSPSPASAHLEGKNLLCHKLHSVLLYCVWLGNHGLNLKPRAKVSFLLTLFPPGICSRSSKFNRELALVKWDLFLFSQERNHGLRIIESPSIWTASEFLRVDGHQSQNK